jgi:cytochrome P450
LLQANGGKPPAGMPPAVMDRMLFPKVLKGKPLDAEHMRILLENGKGFIIAGFGTTTDTSVYVWNLLATHPEVLEKVREEHTRVFGKGFERTVELLHEQPSILNSLEYTTAVINETLRLFPVGMVGRGAPENITALEHNGTSHPLQDKIMIGILSHSMHYNPDIFENPDQFRPERFLGEAAAAIPRSAYRPFEQGPRGCVGKALAMDEMRIALALVSRFFDFELIDHEPRKEPTYSHMSLDSKLGKHAFQVHAFTAMPAGPVKMRIDLVDE